MEAKLLILVIVWFTAAMADGDGTRNGTITSYDPSDLLLKIFNTNGTLLPRQGGYGFKFEDFPPEPTAEDQGQYGLINFEDNRPLRFHDDVPQTVDQNEDRPLKFEDPDQDTKGVTFQNDNVLSNSNKKKRKRRRKPKRLSNQPGVSRPGYPEVPGLYQAYGPAYGYPMSQVPYRRPRRRRPSIASDALTAVTGALTSIALYDDYQCVPRLLCEAAGGGALGTGGILDSVAGIQPLLTLLSAYNGISSSPLFVFGRAVFLGMTSKGNTGTCRYAYPQCPTDPEQLIHYLNNHNGGFFRFFNAPPNQNLQQFYQHLGQNFSPDYQNGFYQPDQQYANGYANGQNPGGYGQNPGSYGLLPQQSLYGNQNYGQNYAYDYNNYGSKIRFRDSKEIEDRIQNRPAQETGNDFDDDDDDRDESFNGKWAFPEDVKAEDYTVNNINNNRIRGSRTLRFPEDTNSHIKIETTNPKRKVKAINFPNTNNLNHYNNPNRVKYYNYNDFNTPKPYNHNHHNNYQNNQNNFNNGDYYFDYKHNFYVKKDNNKVNNDNNDGVKTVYIVRGNGDPNHPEIVKVKPGDRLY